MAQFNFTANTYAGEALAGFMASTLLEADSVERGLITVIQDVKSRRLILDIDDSVVLQTPSAIFTDQGTTALQNESYLDPIPYEFMKEEQYDKLAGSWESNNMKPGAMQDYTAPVELSDFMIDRYKTKIQLANEKLYWNGKGSTKEATFTGTYAGFLPSIAANSSTFKATLPASAVLSATVAATGVVTIGDTTPLLSGDVVTLKVTTGTLTETTPGGIGQALINLTVSYSIKVIDGTTFLLVRNMADTNNRVNATFTGTATVSTISFINASNVLAVLGNMYAQLDLADRDQADYNVMIHKHIGYAYAQAQANKATNVLNAFVLPKQMDYLGIKLQLMSYFQPNTILAARQSNLFLGVDLLGDESSLETADMRIILQNTVRMKARMKSCVNVKFFNEVFYLSA
jgi:hypothetical protein